MQSYQDQLNTMFPMSFTDIDETSQTQSTTDKIDSTWLFDLKKVSNVTEIANELEALETTEVTPVDITKCRPICDIAVDNEITEVSSNTEASTIPIALSSCGMNDNDDVDRDTAINNSDNEVTKSDLINNTDLPDVYGENNEDSVNSDTSIDGHINKPRDNEITDIEPGERSDAIENNKKKINKKSRTKTNSTLEIEKDLQTNQIPINEVLKEQTDDETLINIFTEISLPDLTVDFDNNPTEIFDITSSTETDYRSTVNAAEFSGIPKVEKPPELNMPQFQKPLNSIKILPLEESNINRPGKHVSKNFIKNMLLEKESQTLGTGLTENFSEINNSTNYEENTDQPIQDSTIHQSQKEPEMMETDDIKEDTSKVLKANKGEPKDLDLNRNKNVIAHKDPISLNDNQSKKNSNNLENNTSVPEKLDMTRKKASKIKQHKILNGKQTNNFLKKSDKSDADEAKETAQSRNPDMKQNKVLFKTHQSTKQPDSLEINQSKKEFKIMSTTDIVEPEVDTTETHKTEKHFKINKPEILNADENRKYLQVNKGAEIVEANHTRKAAVHRPTFSNIKGTKKDSKKRPRILNAKLTKKKLKLRKQSKEKQTSNKPKKQRIVATVPTENDFKLIDAEETGKDLKKHPKTMGANLTKINFKFDAHPDVKDTKQDSKQHIKKWQSLNESEFRKKSEKQRKVSDIKANTKDKIQDQPEILKSTQSQKYSQAKRTKSFEGKRLTTSMSEKHSGVLNEDQTKKVLQIEKPLQVLHKNRKKVKHLGKQSQILDTVNPEEKKHDALEQNDKRMHISEKDLQQIDKSYKIVSAISKANQLKNLHKKFLAQRHQSNFKNTNKFEEIYEDEIETHKMPDVKLIENANIKHPNKFIKKKSEDRTNFIHSHPVHKNRQKIVDVHHKIQNTTYMPEEVNRLQSRKTNKSQLKQNDEQGESIQDSALSGDGDLEQSPTSIIGEATSGETRTATSMQASSTESLNTHDEAANFAKRVKRELKKDNHKPRNITAELENEIIRKIIALYAPYIKCLKMHLFAIDTPNQLKDIRIAYQNLNKKPNLEGQEYAQFLKDKLMRRHEEPSNNSLDAENLARKFVCDNLNKYIKREVNEFDVSESQANITSNDDISNVASESVVAKCTNVPTDMDDSPDFENNFSDFPREFSKTKSENRTCNVEPPSYNTTTQNASRTHTNASSAHVSNDKFINSERIFILNPTKTRKLNSKIYDYKYILVILHNKKNDDLSHQAIKSFLDRELANSTISYVNFGIKKKCKFPRDVIYPIKNKTAEELNRIYAMLFYPTHHCARDNRSIDDVVRNGFSYMNIVEKKLLKGFCDKLRLFDEEKLKKEAKQEQITKSAEKENIASHSLGNDTVHNDVLDARSKRQNSITASHMFNIINNKDISTEEKIRAIKIMTGAKKGEALEMVTDNLFDLTSDTKDPLRPLGKRQDNCGALQDTAHCMKFNDLWYNYFFTNFIEF